MQLQEGFQVAVTSATDPQITRLRGEIMSVALSLTEPPPLSASQEWSAVVRTALLQMPSPHFENRVFLKRHELLESERRGGPGPASCEARRATTLRASKRWLGRFRPRAFDIFSYLSVSSSFCSSPSGSSSQKKPTV